MSSYSIKDLESLSGIKAHTLRIWEQRYNIISPKRSDSNIREYDDMDLKLVLNISLLREHGYKISGIAKMSLKELNEQVMKLAEAENLNYPDQIHSLTIAMIDLDENRFEKVIATCILQFGFENTMVNIIYPFLNRIGVLWVTGSIGPAQEHFISNLIRQKTIVAIDSQVVQQLPHSKKFVLFAPEGEFHEIGLLFANYLLRNRNHKVIYLGQSLPFDELCLTCDYIKPDAIFTAITAVPAGQQEVQAYIDRLAEAFPSTEIYLTGYQVVGQDLRLSAKMKIVVNIWDLQHYISN